MSPTTYLQDDSLLSEYKRLRKALPYLTSALVKCLSKTAIMECAKKLGFCKGKRLVFGSLQEADVLMDYCIYSFRRGGKTAIQRYALNQPPPEGSDHDVLLKAMVRSYYSIFQVKDLERGRGLLLFDLFRTENFSLLDIGLSSSAIRNSVFAGRVLPICGYYMTSGAFIPLGRELLGQTVIPMVERFSSRINREADTVFSPPDEARFSMEIIRAALRKGMLERMTYADIGSE
ncbi:MAG: hypothetical protein V1792_11110 [Pseudomonadota bacterium]